MKGNSLYALLLILLVSIISCGKDITQSHSAPRTKDQVGIIASCTELSQAASLAAKLGIKYRIINQKRKIVEFIGIQENTLKKYLPNSKLRSNKLYDKVLISGNFKAQSISNNEYFGAHQAIYRSENSGRYFPHLDQIKSLNVDQFGEGVVIAIIDTGVDYNHPHLSPNILTNEKDRHGENADQIDNDKNGFSDDYVGWDFYNGDAYPIDDNGHGTHVAGLAASTYMGVAPKAKILPVKVLSADGQGDLGTIASGILYAMDRGAKVINLSLGGPAGTEISAQLQEMINIVSIAKQSNTIIVAAAGNGGNDGIGDCNDSSPIYPANIQEDNLVSVASVNAYDELTEYSNFGGSTVHIAAPGGDIYTGGLNSTALSYCDGPCKQSNTPYATSMGTSMATPVVSGAIATLMSKNPSLSYKKIIKALIENGNIKEELSGLVKSSSVIDLSKALNVL